MFKAMGHVILFDMFLNTTFKTTTSFTKVNLYTRKKFKSSGIASSHLI